MPSEAPSLTTLVRKPWPMCVDEVMVIQMLRPTMGVSTPAPGVQPVMLVAPATSEPVPSTRKCLDTVTVAMLNPYLLGG